LRLQVDQVLPKLNPALKLLLVTVHRREAHGEPLRKILRAVLEIHRQRPDVEIAIPVHKNPNVRKTVMEILGLGSERIHLTEPLDYLSFLALMEQSTLILTDSGGVQEEAPTLKKPVLVLRETTERAEAVDAGCAKLVGFDEGMILSTALDLLDHTSAREAMFAQANPFGDGRAVERILKIFAYSSLRQVG
jgi:UDP-N-acetylglucosamine 2-epimerase (non-hydrolysing)